MAEAELLVRDSKADPRSAGRSLVQQLQRADRQEASDLSAVLGVAARSDEVVTGRTIAEAAKSDAVSTGRAVAELAKADPISAGRTIAQAAKADAAATGRLVAESAKADAVATGRLVAESSKADAVATGRTIAEAAKSDAVATGRTIAESGKADAVATGRTIAEAAKSDAVATGRAVAESGKSDAVATGRVVAELSKSDVNTAARVVRESARADLVATGRTVVESAKADVGASGRVLATLANLDSTATGRMVAETARSDPGITGRLIVEAAKTDTRSIGRAVASVTREDQRATGRAVAEAAKADSETTGRILVRSAETDSESTGRVIGESAKQDSAAVGRAMVSSAREAGASESIRDLVQAMVSAVRAEAKDVTAAMAVPVADPEALAVFGTELPVEVWVPEDSPEPGPDPLGDGEWASVGSPFPVDRILAKFSQLLPGAHVGIEVLDQLPAGVPGLAAGRTARSFMTLSPENFDEDEMSAAHATLLVEKSWLDANEVHQWSVQFSRFDEAARAWTPSVAKRVREDQAHVYYSVVIPGFSLWALSGSVDAPDVQFRVDDLVVDPPVGKEGEKVAVRSEVTNLMEEAGVFTASLWLNSQLHSTMAIDVAGKATAAIAFDIAPRAGSYDVRLDRLLTSLVVEAADAPAAAKAGEEAAPAALEARVEAAPAALEASVEAAPAATAASRGSGPGRRS